jgi:hypothetical protein
MAWETAKSFMNRDLRQLRYWATGLQVLAGEMKDRLQNDDHDTLMDVLVIAMSADRWARRICQTLDNKIVEPDPRS